MNKNGKISSVHLHVKKAQPYWYLVSVLAVAIATIVRLLFFSSLGTRVAFVTFFPAVMIAALYGGLWGGLLATAFSAIAASYFFIEPIRSLFIAIPADILALLLFIISCTMISFITEAMHRARNDLIAYKDHLEEIVEERTKDLEQSRQKNQFLANVIEFSGQPFGVGYPDGRLGFTNGALERLTGYNHDELHSMDWINTLTPQKWREIERKKLEELNKTGLPVHYEKEYIRKDGTIVPIELFVHLGTNSDGSHLYYSFITDITERKNAEEDLRRSEERYRTLFETMTEGFALGEMIFDQAGKPFDFRYLAVNPAFENQTGVKAVDIVGRTLLEHFPQAEHMWIERYGEVVLTGKTAHIEEWFRPLGRFFKCSAVRIDNTRFAALFVDITDRKLMEDTLRQHEFDLARVNKELESFSYSISHDLKAPLRTIRSFSKILLEEHIDKLDNDAQDLFMRIIKGSEKMNELIDDMLSLSRISNQELYYQNVNFSALANDIIDELKQSDPGRKIEVSIEMNLHMQADLKLLKIAFQNLLRNAWKFTGKTCNPRIEIGSFKKDGENIYFVKDNGVGFDMKRADKIFEPFNRLHPESDFPGTGIGLAIVERVIQRHRGKIWAESEPGKGATFFFTLS